MPRSLLAHAVNSAKGITPKIIVPVPALLPALLAAVAVVVFCVEPASAAVSTSLLSPPLGPCSGTQCPAAWPPPNNGDFPGRDASINVFAGGSFTAAQSAAEAEGKVVVLGDMTIARPNGGSFNIGVAVGSRVPPPDGDDFLTVGGNLTVNAGNIMIVGGSDSTTTAWGNVRYAGTQSGAINIAPAGTLIHDNNAASPYESLTTVLEDRSTCSAGAAANGTVTLTPSQVTFTGDGTSALQVFNVTGDIGSATTSVGIDFQNIPAGATIVVNMLGTAPLINTYTGSGLPGDQLTELRPKLLWNFPTATSATIGGSAQFQGSIITGNPAGTLTLSAPGTNGRVYAAGNIIQQGTAGTELHSYPFDGSIPDCSTGPSPSPTSSTVSPSSSPSPSPTVSATSSESASPSESATPSASPSQSESPSPSESATPSESPSQSESASPSESPSLSLSPSPSASRSTPAPPHPTTPGPTGTAAPSLARTGAGIEGLSFATALLATLGAAVLLGTHLTARRAKTHRKH